MNTEFAARRKSDPEEITDWRYNSFVDVSNDIQNFTHPEDWEIVEREITDWVKSDRDYVAEVEAGAPS